MIVGFIFLGIGLLYFFEILVPGFNINYRILWPICLIIISFYFMIKDRKVSFWTIIFLFIGGWSLLLNLDIIDENYKKLFFPSILMIVGLTIIFNAISFSNKKIKISEYSSAGVLNFYGIFGGVEEKVNDKDFKGANIYSIFGGCDLDFSNIEMTDKKVVINVYSIFGGSEITMPKDKYNVVYNSMGILGGNDNKSDIENQKGRATIYLNCIAIFGGSDIK